MDVRGKKVTVIGLGNSGVNAALLLADQGAVVRATDSRDTPELRRATSGFAARGIACELGAHTRAFIEGSALAVVSPGVENASPALNWAGELSVPVIGELELGYQFCKGKIIAITGTNGKSTVTTLIGEILKKGGHDTVVCGNIGNSLCGEISRIGPATFVVTEVSSFQLERIREFKPAVALILNITIDHLDRYGTFRRYFDEKMKIFANQGASDALILNADAPELLGIDEHARSRVLWYSRLTRTNGAYLEGDTLMCVVRRRAVPVCTIADIPLKGLHNVENVLASCLAGMVAGVEPESICRTIRSFRGLAHRVEPVAAINGVDYVDDSKGTTVDSTARALESFGQRPVILIAGGRDKNSDYDLIRQKVEHHVKHLILIGEARERIRAALGDLVETSDAATLDEAVRIASRISEPNDVVLLSPMCASFDMFRDYKERGDVFKAAVKGLAGKR